MTLSEWIEERAQKEPLAWIKDLGNGFYAHRIISRSTWTRDDLIGQGCWRDMLEAGEAGPEIEQRTISFFEPTNDGAMLYDLQIIKGVSFDQIDLHTAAQTPWWHADGYVCGALSRSDACKAKLALLMNIIQSRLDHESLTAEIESVKTVEKPKTRGRRL